jgi:hypothetical protein
MLFNWLLNRTKCASFISRVRLGSASDSGLKNIAARRSLDRMGGGPWCADGDAGSDAGLAIVRITLVLVSAGTKAQGWKRNVGGGSGRRAVW